MRAPAGSGQFPQPAKERAASAASTVNGAASEHLIAAERLRRAGKMPEAIQELRAASGADPTASEPWRRLAAIFREAGYLDRESEALVAVVRNDRFDVESVLRLAEIYTSLGWFVQASDAVSVAERAAPGDRRTITHRATLAYLEGRFDDLDRVARGGMRAAPDDPSFLLILSESQRVRGQREEAERSLRRALPLTTEPPQKAREYAALAHLLLDQRWTPPRFVEAEEAARQAVALRPDDAESHYWLGRALERQGKADEATAAYEVTAKQDPGFESVTLQLGRLYQRSPDPKRRAEGERLMASVYPAMEENGRAFSRARDGVRRRFGDPDAHRAVAAWYMRTEEYPKAIMELRQAVQLGGDDAQTRHALVTALRAVGRETEAEEYEKP
jgi:tetratricopeptide (TPR) repeat protein